MTSATTPDDRLTGLIGRLYDACVDPRLWTGMAGEISRTFDSTSAVLKLHGEDAQVQLLEVTDNLLVPESRRAWAEHWHRNDLWVERSVGFGTSRIVTDRDLVTEREQRRSGFYREWLRELDIHHLIGAVFPANDGAALGVLGIHRPRRAGNYTSGDRRKADLLLRHLQRALDLSRRLAHASVKQAAAFEALDRIDSGILVVDRSCRLVYANAGAEAVLRQRTALRVNAGRLLVDEPGLQEQLVSLIGASIDSLCGRSTAAGSALAIPGAGRLPLTLLVVPLSPLGTPAAAGPLALIYVRDPQCIAFDARRLQTLFDFTGTETLIASALAQGRSLAEIARQRRTGLATVRSHLKRILAKTRTHRQAEAVALLAHSIATLRDKP